MSTEERYTEVFSGDKFFPENPTFHLVDICHSLSHLCRFNGHCERFYSVAEHSLLVGWILAEWAQPARIILQGYLHDATEAYLSDVPAPFKQLLPDWKLLENEMEAKLYLQYHLGNKHPIVKTADWYALFIEANQLMKSKGEGWYDPLGVREEAIKMDVPWGLGHSDNPAKLLYDNCLYEAHCAGSKIHLAVSWGALWMP